MKFPKIKKRAKDFLTEEEGKISKQTVLAVGGILAVVSQSSIVKAPSPHTIDTDSISISLPAWRVDTIDPCNLEVNEDAAECDPPQEGTTSSEKSCYAHNNMIETVQDPDGEYKITSKHQHHFNHCSHASHGSHGSHGSHSSW